MAKYEVGTIVHSNNSGDAEVIERIDGTHLKIRFLNSGIEKVVLKSVISEGCFSDKQRSDYSIGTIIHSNNCGDAEVIERIDVCHVKIRFLDNGIEKIIDTGSIIKGKFSHKEKNHYEVGSVVQSNNYGNAVIIEILDKKHVMVRFDNGNERIIYYSAMAAGRFSDGSDKKNGRKRFSENLKKGEKKNGSNIKI